MDPSSRIHSVTAHTFPYDRSHDLYQEYYRLALRTACRARGIKFNENANTRWSWALSLLQVARDSYRLRPFTYSPLGLRLLDNAARMLARGPLHAKVPIGLYDIELRSGERRRSCIDPRDQGDVSESLAEGYHCYLKTNFWRTRHYPSNVLAAPNMNPLVGRALRRLTKLRHTPKTLGMFAFFRIWGGENEVDGIEHNLQLIESLAKVKCKKYLCAYLVSGNIPEIGKRLSAHGVKWTTRAMPKGELWKLAAQSHLNIVRLGMHECVPWRMTDILAMGGTPVIDYGPQTQWPVPLVEGEHFLSLRVQPGSSNFSSVRENVESWLARPALTEAIGSNTAAYFDAHLAPDSLGDFLLSHI